MRTPSDWRPLLETALQVRERAHASYSEYQVGAALRADDGRVFIGCNVENRSYGLTICAERAAVCAAVAAGATSFDLLVLAVPGAQPPCGACLQVLSEFCDELPILVFDPGADVDENKTAVRELSLERLLPNRFQLPESG